MKTIAPPTVMFSASIVVVNHRGTSGETGPTISPAIPEPRNTIANATYQRTADSTRSNTSEPSGARIAQSPTPPAPRKPPSGIIDSVGAKRIATWPTRSSQRKLRVREKTTIEPASTAKYTTGAHPTGEWNER